MGEFNGLISREETGINSELFRNHFNFQRPSEILKVVCNTNDKKKNSNLMNKIKRRLSDLEKEIKEMGDDEKRVEETDRIVNIVEKILRENQQGQGLKILMLDQMLRKLSITLAQLKAANNPGKPKNEIRQLLFSLYRSEKLTKTIYNNLINII